MACFVVVFLVPVDSDVVLTAKVVLRAKGSPQVLGRVWCCVRAKASTFSNMWCRAWFDSSVQSCAGRRMHQLCTQSHIVAVVGGHHESSHRVGILSVSSCVRCGVVVIAFNVHIDVRDLLFFRSQDVCLKKG